MSDRRKAPWPDYDGNDIYEGDTIKHPSGQMAVVIFKKELNNVSKNYGWRAEYNDGFPSLWLGNQIGGKGQAVVI